MPKPNRFKRNRIVVYVIMLVIPVILLASSGDGQQATSNQQANTPAAGVSPSQYVWSIGSPATLQQAKLAVNYSVITPSYLPVNASLTSVHVDQAFSNYLFLGYVVDGAPVLYGSANPGGWSLIIIEQSSDTNPLSPSTMVASAVVVTATHNGTVSTQTVAQVSTLTSDWQSTSLSGQSVLIQSNIGSQAQSGLQWWNHGVWYRLYANLSMSELEAVAASMITTSTAGS